MFKTSKCYLVYRSVYFCLLFFIFFVLAHPGAELGCFLTGLKWVSDAVCEVAGGFPDGNGDGYYFVDVLNAEFSDEWNG